MLNFKSHYMNLISSILGEFIDDLNDKLVAVKGYEGKFTAENILLKSTALDQISQLIKVPLKLHLGFIKKIEFEINILNALSSPSNLFVSDIHILCSPIHEFDYNFFKQMKNYELNKIITKKFETITKNIFKENFLFNNEKSYSFQQSYFQKIISSLVKNINIYIEKIHFRLEESYNIGNNNKLVSSSNNYLNYKKKRFNLGFVIGGLDYYTCSKSGINEFKDYNTTLLEGKSFKKIDVYGFGVYFNSGEDSIYNVVKLNKNIEKMNINKSKYNKDIDNTNDNNNNNCFDNKVNYNNNKKNMQHQYNKSREIKKTNHGSLLYNYLDNFDEKLLINSILGDNLLPPKYEDYYKFSKKFFIINSDEYSHQYFLLERLDLSIKIRYNLKDALNTTNNSSSKLSLINLEYEQDLKSIYNSLEPDITYMINIPKLKLKTNYNVLSDMVYIFNLSKYHTYNPISILNVKKTFILNKYSSLNIILKGATNYLCNKKYTNVYTKKDLYNTLFNIKVFKELYYLILLNSNNYSKQRFGKKELLFSKILEIQFSGMFYLTKEFHKVQSLLNEKLVYMLRYHILLKFKIWIEDDFKKHKGIKDNNNNNNNSNIYDNNINDLNINNNKVYNRESIFSGVFNFFKRDNKKNLTHIDNNINNNFESSYQSLNFSIDNFKTTTEEENKTEKLNNKNKYTKSNSNLTYNKNFESKLSIKSMIDIDISKKNLSSDILSLKDYDSTAFRLYLDEILTYIMDNAKSINLENLINTHNNNNNNDKINFTSLNKSQIIKKSKLNYICIITDYVEMSYQDVLDECTDIYNLSLENILYQSSHGYLVKKINNNTNNNNNDYYKTPNEESLIIKNMFFSIDKIEVRDKQVSNDLGLDNLIFHNINNNNYSNLENNTLYKNINIANCIKDILEYDSDDLLIEINNNIYKQKLSIKKFKFNNLNTFISLYTSNIKNDNFSFIQKNIKKEFLEEYTAIDSYINNFKSSLFECIKCSFKDSILNQDLNTMIKNIENKILKIINCIIDNNFYERVLLLDVNKFNVFLNNKLIYIFLDLYNRLLLENTSIKNVSCFEENSIIECNNYNLSKKFYDLHLDKELSNFKTKCEINIDNCYFYYILEDNFNHCDKYYNWLSTNKALLLKCNSVNIINLDNSKNSIENVIGFDANVLNTELIYLNNLHNYVKFNQLLDNDFVIINSLSFNIKKEISINQSIIKFNTIIFIINNILVINVNLNVLENIIKDVVNSILYYTNYYNNILQYKTNYKINSNNQLLFDNSIFNIDNLNDFISKNNLTCADQNNINKKNNNNSKLKNNFVDNSISEDEFHDAIEALDSNSLFINLLKTKINEIINNKYQFLCLILYDISVNYLHIKSTKFYLKELEINIKDEFSNNIANNCVFNKLILYDLNLIDIINNINKNSFKLYSIKNLKMFNSIDNKQNLALSITNYSKNFLLHRIITNKSIVNKFLEFTFSDSKLDYEYFNYIILNIIFYKNKLSVLKYANNNKSNNNIELEKEYKNADNNSFVYCNKIFEININNFIIDYSNFYLNSIYKHYSKFSDQEICYEKIDNYSVKQKQLLLNLIIKYHNKENIDLDNKNYELHNVNVLKLELNDTFTNIKINIKTMDVHINDNNNTTTIFLDLFNLDTNESILNLMYLKTYIDILKGIFNSNIIKSNDNISIKSSKCSLNKNSIVLRKFNNIKINYFKVLFNIYKDTKSVFEIDEISYNSLETTLYTDNNNTSNKNSKFKIKSFKLNIANNINNFNSNTNNLDLLNFNNITFGLVQFKNNSNDLKSLNIVIESNIDHNCSFKINLFSSNFYFFKNIYKIISNYYNVKNNIDNIYNDTQKFMNNFMIYNNINNKSSLTLNNTYSYCYNTELEIKTPIIINLFLDEKIINDIEVNRNANKSSITVVIKYFHYIFTNITIMNLLSTVNEDYNIDNLIKLKELLDNLILSDSIVKRKHLTETKLGIDVDSINIEDEKLLTMKENIIIEDNNVNNDKDNYCNIDCFTKLNNFKNLSNSLNAKLIQNHNKKTFTVSLDYLSICISNNLLLTTKKLVSTIKKLEKLINKIYNFTKKTISIANYNVNDNSYKNSSLKNNLVIDLESKDILIKLLNLHYFKIELNKIVLNFKKSYNYYDTMYFNSLTLMTSLEFSFWTTKDNDYEISCIIKNTSASTICSQIVMLNNIEANNKDKTIEKILSIDQIVHPFNVSIYLEYYNDADVKKYDILESEKDILSIKSTSLDIDKCTSDYENNYNVKDIIAYLINKKNCSSSNYDSKDKKTIKSDKLKIINIDIKSIEIDISSRKLSIIQMFVNLINDIKTVVMDRNKSFIIYNSVPSTSTEYNNNNKYIKEISSLGYVIQTIENKVNIRKALNIDNKDSTNNYNNISKIDILKNIFLDLKIISFKIASFVIVLGKESISEIKNYEPIICITLDNILVSKYNKSMYIKINRTQFEYYNNFNEYWEPFVEKFSFVIIFDRSNKSIETKLSKHIIKLYIPNGINFVMSLQSFKSIINIVNDVNNLNDYINESNKDIDFYKNYLNKNEEKNSDKNNYQLLIENNIGEDIYITTNNKEIIEIKDKSTLPLEKNKFCDVNKLNNYKLPKNYNKNTIIDDNNLNVSTCNSGLINTSTCKSSDKDDNFSYSGCSNKNNIKSIIIEKIKKQRNIILKNKFHIKSLLFKLKDNLCFSINLLNSKQYITIENKKISFTEQIITSYKEKDILTNNTKEVSTDIIDNKNIICNKEYFNENKYLELDNCNNNKVNNSYNEIKNNNKLKNLQSLKNNLNKSSKYDINYVDVKHFKLLSEIKVDDYGRKVVSLKSNVTFCNKLSNITLEINIIGNNIDYLITLEPKQKFYIPIRYLSYKLLKLKPVLSSLKNTTNINNDNLLNYNYSSLITNDYINLINGLVLSCKSNKSIKNNDFNVLVYSERYSSDSIDEILLNFDFPFEIVNKLPYNLLGSVINYEEDNILNFKKDNINLTTNIVLINRFSICNYETVFYSKGKNLILHLFSTKFDSMPTGTYKDLNNKYLSCYAHLNLNKLKESKVYSLYLPDISISNKEVIKFYYDLKKNNKLILNFFSEFLIINKLSNNLSFELNCKSDYKHRNDNYLNNKLIVFSSNKLKELHKNDMIEIEKDYLLNNNKLSIEKTNELVNINKKYSYEDDILSISNTQKSRTLFKNNMFQKNDNLIYNSSANKNIYYYFNMLSLIDKQNFILYKNRLNLNKDSNKGNCLKSRMFNFIDKVKNESFNHWYDCLKNNGISTFSQISEKISIINKKGYLFQMYDLIFEDYLDNKKDISLNNKYNCLGLSKYIKYKSKNNNINQNSAIQNKNIAQNNIKTITENLNTVNKKTTIELEYCYFDNKQDKYPKLKIKSYDKSFDIIDINILGEYYSPTYTISIIENTQELDKLCYYSKSFSKFSISNLLNLDYYDLCFNSNNKNNQISKDNNNTCINNRQNTNIFDSNLGNNFNCEISFNEQTNDNSISVHLINKKKSISYVKNISLNNYNILNLKFEYPNNNMQEVLYTKYYLSEYLTVINKKNDIDSSKISYLFKNVSNKNENENKAENVLIKSLEKTKLYINEKRRKYIKHLKNYNYLYYKNPKNCEKENKSTITEENQNKFTTVICFQERVLIYNKTNMDIILTQESCFNKEYFCLCPNTFSSFHWTDSKLPFRLKIKTFDSTLSECFPINQIGEFYINLKCQNIINSKSTDVNYLYSVNIVLKICINENYGINYVIIEDKTNDPPILIKNYSKSLLLIKESNNKINYSTLNNKLSTNNKADNLFKFISIDNLKNKYNTNYYNILNDINVYYLKQHEELPLSMIDSLNNSIEFYTILGGVESLNEIISYSAVSLSSGNLSSNYKLNNLIKHSIKLKAKINLNEIEDYSNYILNKKNKLNNKSKKKFDYFDSLPFILLLSKDENLNYVLKIYDKNCNINKDINYIIDNSKYSLNELAKVSVFNNKILQPKQNINNIIEDNKFVNKEGLEILINIKFISFSFIDQAPKEIGYLHIDTINLTYNVVDNLNNFLNLTVNYIQLDNSLSYHKDAVIMKISNNIDLSLNFTKNNQGSIYIFKELIFNISYKICINLDGYFAYEIYNYFNSLLLIFNNKKNTYNKASNDNKTNILNNNNVRDRLNSVESVFSDNNTLQSNNNTLKSHNNMMLNKKIINDSLIAIKKPLLENNPKYLIQKIYISHINIDFSFNPNYKILPYLNKKQKMLFLFTKIENMNVYIDSFTSIRLKSLETVLSLLTKNILAKNKIIFTKYLFSSNLFLNISSLYGNLKLGLEPLIYIFNNFDNEFYITNNNEYKYDFIKNIFKLPKNLLKQTLKISILIAYNLNLGIIKLLETLVDINMFYFSKSIKIRLNPNINYTLSCGNNSNSNSISTELKLYNNNIYNSIIQSKLNLSKVLITDKNISLNRFEYIYKNKYLYLIYNLNKTSDIDKLFSMYYYYLRLEKTYNFRYKSKKYLKEIIFKIIQLVYLPINSIIILSKYFNTFLDNTIRKEFKFIKVKPNRYIDKHSGRIEEYNLSKSLAMNKIESINHEYNSKESTIFDWIKNKNNNIVSYYELNNNESLVITKTNIIYITKKVNLNNKLSYKNKVTNNLDFEDRYLYKSIKIQNIKLVKLLPIKSDIQNNTGNNFQNYNGIKIWYIDDLDSSCFNNKAICNTDYSIENSERLNKENLYINSNYFKYNSDIKDLNITYDFIQNIKCSSINNIKCSSNNCIKKFDYLKKNENAFNILLFKQKNNLRYKCLTIYSIKKSSNKVISCLYYYILNNIKNRFERSINN